MVPGRPRKRLPLPARVVGSDVLSDEWILATLTPKRSDRDPDRSRSHPPNVLTGGSPTEDVSFSAETLRNAGSKWSPTRRVPREPHRSEFRIPQHE